MTLAGASVLAVVVARIGDTLLATPALRAMREGTRRLTVLAHPKRLDVLQHLEFIDELGAITKDGAWFKGRLRPVRHDVALCYGRDAALLRYCTRVARATVCFDYAELPRVEGASVIRVPVPPDKSLHAVDERMLLALAAGASLRSRRLAYVVSEQERAFALDWISRHVPGGARPLIGLQPFSFPTKAHRDWPVGHFAALAGLALQQDSRSFFVLLGDASAASCAGVFEQAIAGRYAVAAGRLTLRQSAALMQQLSLYIGVDTGPTHIAGALDIPMVALYHPSYPGRNLMPLERPRCAVIEHPGAGAADAAGARMGEIPVEQVWAAARELLVTPA